MKNRVLTSVAIFISLMLLIIFSEFIFYSVALGLLAVVAAYEMFRVIGLQKKLILTVPAYFIVISFPIVAYFLESSGELRFLLVFAACLFVYLMWLMCVSVFSRGSIPFSKISEVFVAVTYVSISLTSLSLIRYMNSEFGLFTVLLVFIIAWVSDIFAFAVGSLIGKHKLIPEVSPKKTVEGAIGGIVFSIIACVLYGLLIDIFVEEAKVYYLVLSVFGLVLSVVSQIGDLIASVIKREYGIKDYGKIFPGHGGVMDRFDSVFAVSTIMMILCIIFPPFASI